MKRIKKFYFYHVYWNFSNEKHFFREHQTIKAFDSRQFHDQYIDGFDFFCIRTNYKTSAPNQREVSK